MDEMLNQVERMANRLRMVQIDFADESEQDRQGYLAEEIERGLEKIIPQQRQAFLQELMVRFPTWDNYVKAPTEGAEAEERTHSPLDQKELQDPSFLLARLADIADDLTGEQKENIITRLKELGLTPPAEGGFSPSSMKKLNRAMETSEQQFDPDRLAELTVLLADFTSKLEPLVWRIWRTLAPHSTVRRPVEFKKILDRFFAGDQLESYSELSGDLEILRQLIASLLSAVGQADNLFAQKHARRFSVSEIENMVKMEPKGILTSHEVRCWRKYMELAEKYDAATIEAEIRKAIVDCAESLLKGSGR